ncbi:MAG TPA: hypothetical protein VMX18_04175 [Candidatus Bipolaricaulota bacterium]|nr:hypothetical protein [Candidatus Bipolaricaulota bacterium]
MQPNQSLRDFLLTEEMRLPLIKVFTAFLTTRKNSLLGKPNENAQKIYEERLEALLAACKRQKFPCELSAFSALVRELCFEELRKKL